MSNSQTIYARQLPERGFTLVEIMVAVTISLLLLAGVMQIFISSKAAYNLQSGVSRMHENARFASDILANNIGLAGYNVTNAFTTANTQDNVTANATLGFSIANGTASDTIEISYESPLDCLGNATGGTATDRYYLNGTDLMCLGNGSNVAGILAEGIENLQFLYGEDTDDDDTANRYVNADNVVDFNDVVSVRMAFLANTVQTVSGANDTSIHILLNTPPIGPLNDNLMRRVFVRTVVLRNQALSL